MNIYHIVFAISLVVNIGLVWGLQKALRKVDTLYGMLCGITDDWLKLKQRTIK